ncbi:MAG TPA: ATP-binding cassette domain-containing protein [Candidatus Bathyarchaeia archaeon]|nr:ATP-binding cassette domain-containing protein [Candidatus Bathyarchaeia archaeon]
MNSHLEAQGLTKTYDGLLALEQVNVRASTRQVTSIVGVNGAGKTTLLRILAGLDTPNEGKIVIGAKMLGLEELRTYCTMVFQKSVMFGGTVYDNVAYGLRINGCSKQNIQDRVTMVLAMVNLNGFEKRKARKLSSGEQQRVAIARALALEREVLLIDEPTSNLDPANAIIVEQIIRKSAESRIVLLSTHNLPQARRLSHRIIHLHSGRVVEDQDTASFFANPHDERTRLFISGELQF